MSNENSGLSRRRFLSTGIAAAGVSSIIAIQASAATRPEAQVNNIAKGASPMLLSDDPVTTEAVQTLTNKTIPSRSNITGSDYVNIREYTITGTDITAALNSAISYLTTTPGGRILIPNGRWTSKGGHNFVDSISIEGVGYNPNPGLFGTEIKLTTGSGASNYMFGISATHQHCSLKNLSVDLSSNSSAIGLWMTNIPNYATNPSGNIYFTNVENVGFNGGAYGIKVESKVVSGVGTNFECMMNRFENVTFVGCVNSFYCDSVNGGYSFDNCLFSLPTSGIALNCVAIGNLSVEHCSFFGQQTHSTPAPASDGTTVLNTVGVFNNISLSDCQDENVEYAYQKSSNYFPQVPVVFKNCLIQSKLQFGGSGSVIIDTCRVAADPAYSAAIKDSPGGFVFAYLKGINTFFTASNPFSGGKIADFNTAGSKLIYEAVEIGPPEITPVSTTAGYFQIHKSLGTVTIAAGTSYIGVYSYLSTADSLIFAQLRTYDSGGARIRDVQCYAGYFQINLTQNAASNLSIGFMFAGYHPF